VLQDNKKVHICWIAIMLPLFQNK